MEWTHDQLEGFMGRWFVDRGWYPCLTEMDVGYVDEGGNLPRWAKSDEDFIEYHMRWLRMTLEQAQAALKVAHDRRWVADVAGLMLVSKSRFHAMRLDGFWNMDSAIPYYLSWLCEVKVQRSDFLKDDKFEKPPQAHMQFLAVPKGLIRHEEIPKGWGLLEVAGDEYGARVYKTMDRCELNLIPLEIAGGLVEQMVWTMWWRYRMGAMREFHRKSEYAIVERDSAKVSTIVEAVMSYLQANNKYLEEKGRGTLREYLSLSGVKRRVKGWTLEKAERLREEFQCRKN